MQLGNWIQQTTTTTGTGNLTLAAVTGYSQFTDQFATGTDGSCDHFFYSILTSAGAPVEAGIGHIVTTGPAVLVRDHVLATMVSGTYSEANTPVSLSAGTYTVACTDLNSCRQMGFAGPRSGATTRLIGSAELITSAGNTKTYSAGNVYVVPFTMRTFAIISGAGCFVASTGGTNVRLGLYRTMLNGEPGNLICATGDIVASSVGFVSGAWGTGSQTIKPGRYYLAIKPNGSNVPLQANAASPSIVSQDGLTGMGSGAMTFNTFGSATDSGSAMSTTMASLAWTAALSDYSPTLYLVPTTL